MQNYYAKVHRGTLSFEAPRQPAPEELALLLPSLLSKWRTLFPSLHQLAFSWDPHRNPHLIGLFLDHKATLLPLPYLPHTPHHAPVSLRDYSASLLAYFSQAKRTQRVAHQLLAEFNSHIDAIRTQYPEKAPLLAPLQLVHTQNHAHPYPIDYKFVASTELSSPLSNGYLLVKPFSIKIHVSPRIQILISTTEHTAEPDSEQLRRVLRSWFSLLDKAKSDHIENIYVSL